MENINLITFITVFLATGGGIFSIYLIYKKDTNNAKEIKEILEDEIIKEYLKEDGKIRNEHKDIMNVLKNDILDEKSEIRRRLDTIYEHFNPENKVKTTGVDFTKILEDIVAKQLAFQKLIDENKKMKADINSLNKRVRSLEDSLKLEQDKNSELLVEILNKENEIDGLSEEIRIKENKIEVLKEKNEELKEEKTKSIPEKFIKNTRDRKPPTLGR